MKAKMNFSGAGIKKFFVNNGEKLVLALSVLLFLGFIYSAMNAKPLDDSKSPDAINRESRQLVASIQTPTWNEHRTEMGLTAPHYKQETDNSLRPVSGQKVAPSRDWNPPLFPELIKRVDPEIFAVEDLQIDAGCGIVPYRSAAAAGTAPRPGVAPGGRFPSGPPVGPPMGGPPVGGPPMGGPMGGPPMGGPFGAPGGFNRSGSETALLPGVHAPGADAQRKNYVVVTGAVPVEKEAEEYRRRFEYAMPAIPDPSRMKAGAQFATQTDSPHYFCFLIERSEVKDADDKNRNWVQILSKANYANAAAMKDIEQWISPAPEIVSPDDVFQPEVAGAGGNKPFNAYITWPLPPLFLKNWGFEAAHPKVKLNITEEATPQAAAEGTQAPGVDLNNAAPEARSRFGGGPNIGPPGVFRGPPAGIGPPGMGYGMGNRGPNAMQTAETFVDPYRIFRFVDLTAEPGKTYRYRVQILLYNPNYGLSQECLDSKVIQAGTDKKRLSESNWMETPAITVPHDYQILADSINFARQTAKINLLAIAKTPADTQNGAQPANPDTYVEIVKEIDLPLGGVPFVRDQDIDKVIDMSSESIRKVEKINVDTNQTVLLDVRNDKPLGEGRMRDATELLLMDGAGNLLNASRAADKLVLEDYQQRSKPPAEMKESPSETPTPRPGPTNLRNGPPTGRGPAKGVGPPTGKGGR